MDIIENKYRIERLLAKGGFAEVFLATDIINARSVAIKRIVVSSTEDGSMSRVELEIDAMSKLRHPNIIGYHETIKHADYWYIVMEYCECGTLSDVVTYLENETRKQNINFNREAHVYYYMNQIKEGLRYIQLNNYVHRDIKCANILIQSSDKSDIEFPEPNYDLNRKLIVKIADFGLTKSTTLSATPDLLSTMCGSPLTMAPEMIAGRGYTSKADLWSIGVVMYQLMFSLYPTHGETCQDLFKNIVDTDKTINFHLYKDFEAECFGLVSGLLNKIPDRRLSWDDFFSHKWFKKWSKRDLSSVLPSTRSKFDSSNPINIASNTNLSATTALALHSAFNMSGSTSKSSEYSDSGTSRDSDSSTRSGSFGESNLSKMRISFTTTTKAKPTGTYADYPSSYPPTDERKRTNPLDKTSFTFDKSFALGQSTTFSQTRSTAPPIVQTATVTSSEKLSTTRSRIFSQSIRKPNPGTVAPTEPLDISFQLTSLIAPKK
jgi:serine/threonine protein kinase